MSSESETSTADATPAPEPDAESDDSNDRGSKNTACGDRSPTNGLLRCFICNTPISSGDRISYYQQREPAHMGCNAEYHPYGGDDGRGWG